MQKTPPTPCQRGQGHLVAAFSAQYFLESDTVGESTQQQMRSHFQRHPTVYGAIWDYSECRLPWHCFKFFLCKSILLPCHKLLPNTETCHLLCRLILDLCTRSTAIHPEGKSRFPLPNLSIRLEVGNTCPGNKRPRLHSQPSTAKSFGQVVKSEPQTPHLHTQWRRWNGMSPRSSPDVTGSGSCVLFCSLFRESTSKGEWGNFCKPLHRNALSHADCFWNSSLAPQAVKDLF